MSRWTEEERRILKEMYPHHTAKEVAAVLGRNTSSVHNQARFLGVKPSRERLQQAGRELAKTEKSAAARFKVGHIPAGKGKKVSQETYAKMRRTMFQKGHTPANHKEVGSERVSRDGYVEVKVAEPNTWRHKHRVIWEQANGKIPKGCNIQFRNGDKTDIRLENLYIISRQEQLMTENCMRAKYPEELQQIIMLKAALKRKIKSINKKQNGKES
jgi:hypothetical protein